MFVIDVDDAMHAVHPGSVGLQPESLGTAARWPPWYGGYNESHPASVTPLSQKRAFANASDMSGSDPD